MSNNELPEEMPPVPEGAVLDGQLKDHPEGVVRGHLWNVGDRHWSAVGNYWGGPRYGEIWFARVDPPEVENARLRSELVEARARLVESQAREAALKDRLQEYHDNAHYDDEDKLYIGCCITESQYQDTANLLAASGPSLAKVRAGVLEDLADQVRHGVYGGGEMIHPEAFARTLEDKAARLRAGKEERLNETC